MAKFAFALKQRVSLPGHESVQCVVIGRSDDVEYGRMYRVKWVVGDGKVLDDWFSEELLVAANPRDVSGGA